MGQAGVITNYSHNSNHSYTECCHAKKAICYSALALSIICILGGILTILAIAYPQAVGALNAMSLLTYYGAGALIAAGCAIIPVALLGLVKMQQSIKNPVEPPIYESLVNTLVSTKYSSHEERVEQMGTTICQVATDRQSMAYFVKQFKAEPKSLAEILSKKNLVDVQSKEALLNAIRPERSIFSDVMKICYEEGCIPLNFMTNLSESEMDKLIEIACTHEQKDSCVHVLLKSSLALRYDPELVSSIAPDQVKILRNTIFDKLRQRLGFDFIDCLSEILTGNVAKYFSHEEKVEQMGKTICQLAKDKTSKAYINGIPHFVKQFQEMPRSLAAILCKQDLVDIQSQEALLNAIRSYPKLFSEVMKMCYEEGCMPLNLMTNVSESEIDKLIKIACAQGQKHFNVHILFMSSVLLRHDPEFAGSIKPEKAKSVQSTIFNQLKQKPDFNLIYCLSWSLSEYNPLEMAREKNTEGAQHYAWYKQDLAEYLTAEEKRALQI